MACDISARQKPKIAISACLLGAEVRFNGGHKESRLCSQALSEHSTSSRCAPKSPSGLAFRASPSA